MEDLYSHNYLIHVMLIIHQEHFGIQFNYQIEILISEYQ